MQPPIAMTQMGLGGLGTGELVVVLIIVLIIFGAGRLPTIGQSLGQAIKNFKKGMKGDDSEERKDPPDERTGDR